jgi:hypothetical protein
LLKFGQAAHVEEATRSDHLEKRCAQREVKSATPLARELGPRIYRIFLTFPNNKFTGAEIFDAWPHGVEKHVFDNEAG